MNDDSDPTAENIFQMIPFHIDQLYSNDYKKQSSSLSYFEMLVYSSKYSSFAHTQFPFRPEG